MNTLASVARHEEEIRKSRFIAYAGPARTVDQALQWITTQSHADARHNCWAYRVGNEYRFNDAGEPSGSAGRPMLAAIDGQGFDQVAVLVVRYFGGIKLGMGGLVRAYGGCAARCLHAGTPVPIVSLTTLRLEVPFEFSDLTHRLLDESGGASLTPEYSATGLTLLARIPAEACADFTHRLKNASGGRVRWTELSC